MSAYPSDSPQGRVAALLSAAGLPVDPGTRPPTGGARLQMQLGGYTAVAEPGDPTGTVNVVVTASVSAGDDLWSLVADAWAAVLASESMAPLGWSTAYGADLHSADIVILTGETP